MLAQTDEALVPAVETKVAEVEKRVLQESVSRTPIPTSIPTPSKEVFRSFFSTKMI